MNLEIDIQEERPAADTVLLRVSGRVNIHTSSKLRNRLKPLLTDGVHSVYVALNGVDFMDSSGIATLVEGLQWSRASGGEFVLTGLSDTVRDVFTLAKLDTVFDIRDSGPGA
ncbi:MAG TPA: STAS domain-containing protein [Mariprofundaceae bacterium]|nr:STAS domain-containing protein [Mariprofundaceae bacterium]